MYRKRILDKVIENELRASRAILIIGPKFSGKTSSVMQFAKSIFKLDDFSNGWNNIELAKINPGLALEGETPRLIDEWQLVPKIFDAVRVETDKRNLPGQFILTGSNAIPYYQKKHSGTGRITIIEMRMLSLFESEDSTGEISLEDLLLNKQFYVNSNMSISRLAQLIVRGGYPSIFSIKEEKDHLKIHRNYFKSLIESDISMVDEKKRNPRLCHWILKSIARNLQTRVKYTTIKYDILNLQNETISIPTLTDYINTLTNLRIVDFTENWSPSFRSKTMVMKTPVIGFVDPSIAVAALSITEKSLLTDIRTFGFLFESLVIRDLKIYASYYGGEVYSYRDRSNIEIDAVITFPDGRYGLIEIKLGRDYIEDAIKNLKLVENKLNIEVMGKPSFKAVITGTGFGYQRDDGIYIIPIGTLKH
ncbi:ATP-binding protein [Ureaplasma canigenitalium]|uniref:ATP-binding protein n=1 Tax=Ureaplasma canigenitalium TaxID=42092 RepID=UPI0004E1465B|nr:DUF4143 domain-containing protein [Ureaplasma canigenitalium]